MHIEAKNVGNPSRPWTSRIHKPDCRQWCNDTVTSYNSFLYCLYDI